MKYIRDAIEVVGWQVYERNGAIVSFYSADPLNLALHAGYYGA